MIDINNYMNDGAGWQAQAVLAYLKGNLGRILADTYYKTSVMVEVGRYENCREQGYVFTLRFHTKEKGYVQRNYAVYQHRNTDSICVLISNTITLNTPTIDDMWKDKGENPKSSQYDQGFEWDDIVLCGEYILTDMEEFLSKYEIL